MADIRIKDLSSASSTASDDFIAVDGTTNGTRKLNAFSPTFGGNATVTGTLTVNGSGTTNIGGMVRAQTATYSDSSPAGLSQAFQVDTAAASTRDLFSFGDSARHGLIRGYQDGAGVVNFRFGRYAASTFSEYVRIAGDTATNAVFTVYGTTASTTTSTGALVVSGGLGVGGNINAGGYLRSINSSAANGSVFDAFRADIGADGTLGALEVKAGGLPSATAGSRYGYILAGDAGAFRKFYVGGTASGGAQVLIPATDTSTSTSSGALVVSGGVGVAGAVFTGGYVHPGGDSTFYIRGTGSNNGLIRGNVTSVDVDASFSVRNGDGSSTYLSVASTGLIAAIPATAPSLTVNGTMTFERTSNTSLKISVRGTDGTTRSVSLTLA